ncbi:MAG TPA: winged helix-turn-helix domain-containing protein, partial [Burkholderiaceae bacterium]|nr:winged helix-turn-helix domain-containing protein [Burkholderiaceae bacterium]
MASRFAFGPFLLDVARGTLIRDGVAVAAGQPGLRILKALLEAGGEPVAKDRLLELGWPGRIVEENNLSVQVAALRRLLGSADDGTDWIVTVQRHGYRFAGTGAVEIGAVAPMTDPFDRDASPPSIAVLPFENFADDAKDDYFADGVTDDLIATLTRFRWFEVIGRNASHVYKMRAAALPEIARELGVRYLVEGTVRRAGERVRISARLVDGIRGSCLWAERYDFGLADVVAVQDAIAQQVAGAIEPELLKHEGSRAMRRRAGTVNGWDLVAQGSWYFHHVTRPTHLKARELFRQARRLDPEMPEALLWIGRVDAGLVAYGWSDSTASDLDEGRDAALQAVQRDERSPYAHYALAIVTAYRDEFDLSRRAAEKAIELNPSFALGHLVFGMASLFAGDAGRAAASIEHGLGLNRFDPQNFIWFDVLALAHLFGGNPQAALDSAMASLKIRPNWRSTIQIAAAGCAALGLDEDARR